MQASKGLQLVVGYTFGSHVETLWKYQSSYDITRKRAEFDIGIKNKPYQIIFTAEAADTRLYQQLMIDDIVINDGPCLSSSATAGIYMSLKFDFGCVR